MEREKNVRGLDGFLEPFVDPPPSGTEVISEAVGGGQDKAPEQQGWWVYNHAVLSWEPMGNASAFHHGRLYRRLRSVIAAPEAGEYVDREGRHFWVTSDGQLLAFVDDEKGKAIVLGRLPFRRTE